jgi:hypothetical protein
MTTNAIMRAFRLLSVMAAAACAVAAAPTPALAQLVDVELAPKPRSPGIVFTPSASIGLIRDDNAIVASEGNPTQADTALSVRPGLDLALTRKHTVLAASYFGGLMRYQTLDQINSYDQTARAEFRHQPGRRVQLFVQNAFSVNPSTEAVEEPDVIFLRTGTRKNTLDGGASVAISRQMHLTAQYHFQWLKFERTFRPADNFLEGGTSHGVTADLRRRVTRHWSVGAAYEVRHAIVADGTRTSDIQNAEGVLEWEVSPTVQVEGGAGVSHVLLENALGSRTAPAGHISVRKQTEHAVFMASAAQSFRPSFGSGRSTKNRQFSVGAYVPFAADRAFASGQLKRHDNEPAAGEGLATHANWVHVAVGYALSRYFRVEGFYVGAFQNTSVVGGVVHRNRFGVLFSTSAPMRID